MNLKAILEERLALMAPARRLRLALAEREVARRSAGDGRLQVLDAGCGDGLLSLAIAKHHSAWAIVGVDLREDMLDGARRRAAARGLSNVRFVPGNLEEPLPEAGRDVVLAVECLSEIPDDRRALQMMFGALRSGGSLVLQVPERDWQPVLPGSPGTWREQVRQGYTAEQLEALLRESGFSDVQVRPTYRSLAAGAQEISDRIKRSPLPVRLLAFPFLAAAVRLERAGLTFGRPNALIAAASKP
ncbi:MAG TPA: methyltransferase domain-containing protein [Solirubrobacterales bacterium]|jgi:SAM-dependent methyltransferase|nr:methyltransferase domain-containing protein [Solirubrobacterales bacterium]